MWLVLVKPSGWVLDKLFIRSSNALLSMLAISCRRIQSQASSLGYPSARPSFSFIHTVGLHSALISLVPYKLSEKVSAMLSYILCFLAALLVHELGHCVAAFGCNVTVSEFGFGWGRKLCSLRIRGVDFIIRVLPVGAYIRLNLDELQERQVDQQVTVLLAGIIANLVAGVVTGGTHFS